MGAWKTMMQSGFIWQLRVKIYAAVDVVADAVKEYLRTIGRYSL